MEPQNPVQNRTTIVERGKSIWEDFGPFIVGIVVLLVVLGGVWYLWSKRAEMNTDTSSVLSENQNTGGTVPLSQLSLNNSPTPVATIAPSPSPLVSPKATPSGAPEVVNMTKGGLESTASGTTKGGLPQTGFAENLLGGLFLAMAGAGFYLRKLAGKIS